MTFTSTEKIYGKLAEDYVTLSRQVEIPYFRPGGPVIDDEGRTKYALEPLDAQIHEATTGLGNDQKALVIAFSKALRGSNMPSVAPEKYSKRQRRDELGGRKENAIEFLERVYPVVTEEYVTFAEIKRLDSSLYTGIHNWLKTHSLPERILIRTVSEDYDEIAAPILCSLEDSEEVLRRAYNLMSAIFKRALA